MTPPKIDLKTIATSLVVSTILLLSCNFLPTSQPPSTVVQNVKLQAPKSAVRQVSTEEYIESFNPKKYEIAGTDFFNERYSPHRLNKPLNQIDITFDFDFGYLKEVSDRLVKVDRPQALHAIFEKIVVGAKSNTERHLAVLTFLQKAAFHSAWMQPMYEDKQAVFDPLVLLEIGTMRCGAVARVGADLFDAAGYKSRLVQAIAHTTAEIFYDGDWHLFEGDLNGGGQAPMINGRILSVSELSRNPAVLDRLPSRFEAEIGFPPEKGIRKSLPYPSYFFFSKQGYETVAPSWYYKTATPEQAATSQWYGWNYYEMVPSKDRKLDNSAAKFDPTRPRLQEVVISGNRALVSWEEPDDGDNDLIGYRIYISNRSRGWNHQNFIGGASAKKYWNGGWKPEMYDALFKEPASELGFIETKNTSVEIELPYREKRYVTVMPYDQYGESIGRRLYNMSEELTLSH